MTWWYVTKGAPTAPPNGGPYVPARYTEPSGALGSGEPGVSSWEDLQGKPDVFPPGPHTHTWASVTGKPLTFTPSPHQHTVADIVDFPTSLPAEDHVHQLADIEDFPEGTRGDVLWFNGVGWESRALLYVHIQHEPATVWLINHQTNSYPAVRLENTAGEMLIADPQHISPDLIRVEHERPVSGRAYCKL